jgi:hypothetical protein
MGRCLSSHALAGASHLLATCSSLILLRKLTEAPIETKAPDKPTAREVWTRGLFMLVLIIGFAVGQWLLNLLALMQFLWLLFAREPNGLLAGFGNSHAIWLAEVSGFLTCATEDKPFPWRAWPGSVDGRPVS